MIKRALPAMIGVLGLCLPVIAQEATDLRGPTDLEVITPEELRITGEVETGPALNLYRPDIFNTVDGSTLIHGLPALVLLDGRRFLSSSELGRMGMTPLDIFPLAFLSAVEVQKVGSNPIYGSDGPGGVVNLMGLNRMQTGGEVGFFYGKSSGKYGREDMAAHIIGSVGNEKFQITVGAAYHESEGRYRGYRR